MKATTRFVNHREMATATQQPWVNNNYRVQIIICQSHFLHGAAVGPLLKPPADAQLDQKVHLTIFKKSFNNSATGDALRSLCGSTSPAVTQTMVAAQ